MVKKLKSLAKTEDKHLADAVRTSASQIWQAGLGAFAKAQEEGGRVFSKLVEEGNNLQRRTRSMAEDRVSDVSDTVTKVADGVSKQASGSWDKLEQVFEDRVARALSTIGVPTQKDIQELTRRVEQLSRAVTAATVKKTFATKAGHASVTEKPASARSAVKKAAVSKPAAKKTAVKAAPEKPTAKKSAAVKAVAVKPAAGKPAAVAPTAVKPTAVKPAAVKPAARKASVRKTAVKANDVGGDSGSVA